MEQKQPTVSYETAQALKEAGRDKKCVVRYEVTKNNITQDGIVPGDETEIYEAPNYEEINSELYKIVKVIGNIGYKEGESLLDALAKIRIMHKNSCIILEDLREGEPDMVEKLEEEYEEEDKYEKCADELMDQLEELNRRHLFATIIKKYFPPKS